MIWNEVKEFAANYVTQNNAEFQSVAKQIWGHPELGMEEHEACRLHKQLLRKHGFTVMDEAASMPTAYIASYGEGRPVIGISAEMDALPGLSQRVMERKEPVQEGAPGHGCGHNLLGVGAILAAVAVAAALQEYKLPGTVKVFGAPAEELCIGKVVMGNAGLFQGVDVFLDWHPFPYSHTDYAERPAYFNVRYHFKGKTSHGVSPWLGRSAFDAALLQGMAVEMLREHIPPGPAGTDDAPGGGHSINYTFSDTGPEIPNVVPDRTTAWYLGRLSNAELAQEVLARLDACAEGAALATGTTVEKEYITFVHEMIPNQTVSNALYENFQHLGDVVFSEEEKAFVLAMEQQEGMKPYFAEPGIRPPRSTVKGVIDSTEYSWVAPYGYVAVNLGPGMAWHNWLVTACAGGSHGEKTLNKAAQVLATTALDFIQDAELLQKAQDEHKQRMAGRAYGSLLPEGTPIPLHINKAAMAKYRKE